MSRPKIKYKKKYLPKKRVNYRTTGKKPFISIRSGNGEIKKVVCYVRTCANNNHIDGAGSLHWQNSQIADYAGENGIEIVRCFYDENSEHSTDLKSRDAFKNMIKFINRDPSIDGIIVESAGRISRKSMHHLNLEKDVQDSGLNIICCDLPKLYETAGSTMNMMLYMTIIFLEYQEESGFNLRTWTKYYK